MLRCPNVSHRAHHTAEMEEQDGVESSPPPGDLRPCRVCGRTFFPAVLKKHVPICQKAASKKRKTFDSSRQRAEGTDVPTVKPLKPKPEPPKKPSNWRRKHEEFIATIRAAKEISNVMKAGGPPPPPPPPSYDPDYIQCPYCQRRFNESAADRHVKFCKEQAARISNRGKFPGDAKGKLPARSQCKTPAVKRTNSPVVSNVSSYVPQRSPVGQYTAAGRPTSKTLSGGPTWASSSVSSLTRSSPTGMRCPPAGLSSKSRLSRSPGSLRTTTGAGVNRKKECNADSHSTSDDVQPGLEEDHRLSQLTKFCHACGTKYPMASAKFCPECGVRRMQI